MTFNFLSLVMGACYMLLGIFVIKYNFFIVQLQERTAYALGILLIFYGIFRIVRAVLSIKKAKK